jgi:Fe-S-cluster containining protein
VTPEEVAAIAAHRREPVEETQGLYTRLEGRRRTLREKGNGDCVFWDKRAGCTVYPVRPMQCQTWPFWASNVESPAAWEQAAAGCPGCGRGELIPVEEITLRVRQIKL